MPYHPAIKKPTKTNHTLEIIIFLPFLKQYIDIFQHKNHIFLGKRLSALINTLSSTSLLKLRIVTSLFNSDAIV